MSLCTIHDCHLYGVCYAEAHGQPEKCDATEDGVIEAPVEPEDPDPK